MIDASPETAVIGIALRDRKALDDIDHLDPTDFQDHRLGELWALIRRHHQTGRPHDPTAINASTTIPGLTAFDIQQLAHEAPLGATADYYGSIVTAEAIRARLRTAGAHIVQLADETTTEDMPDTIEIARAELDAAGRISGTAAGIRAGDYFTEFMAHIDDPVELHPTPWPSLDHLIGGLRPGAVYVIGARPSVGKSVVGLQLANYLQQEDRGAVLFTSLEMTRDEIQKRLIAQTATVPLSAFDGTLEPRHRDAIARHADALARNRIHLDDRASLTPGDIRSTARTLARRSGLAGVVVDYLQLMESTRATRTPRHEAIAQYSRSLKLLAKELHVPVVVLSQLNRNSARGDVGPSIADLRESGAIEQDADVIILLHQDREQHPGSLFMKVGKNRHGPTGAFELGFEGHYARAREMPA